MRVLIVCSGNSGKISPFVQEQVDEIAALGIETCIFPIIGKGIKGYLRNYPSLRNILSQFKPDLIHAHSGMSALLCGLQRRVPVVATYHGSDVNDAKLRKFTRISMALTRKQILVSEPMREILGRTDIPVIPCGVDVEIFQPYPKNEARKKLGLKEDGIYILFSSAFNNPVKHVKLAQKAIEQLQDPKPELIELSNKSREEVSLLLNACDIALLTSKSEGSPQFIKEALACCRPIVATNVGDVFHLLAGLEGTYICNQHMMEIKHAIERALLFSQTKGQTSGNERIAMLQLDSKIIAKRIIEVYKSVIH